MNPIENEQLCKSTLEALRYGVGGLSSLPGLIKKIIETRAWESRMVRGKLVQFKSLREMITTSPMDGGWGEEVGKIEQLLKGDADAETAWREEMKEQGRRNDLGDNVTEVKAEKGNSRAYTLTRLQKHHPELYERVKAGEISANAAAIEAGFRKKPNGLAQMKRTWAGLTKDEQAEFLTWIADC
jgi:hypothetical protein